MLPPVVAGVALVTALGRTGLVGRWLYEWFGLTLPYTTAAVVIAHTFVSIPFYVLSVEGALRAVGGASSTWSPPPSVPIGGRRSAGCPCRWRFPGVVAGAALAWARSLGEFGATITFAGNYPGTTQTMPSKIYTALQSQPDVARTLSMILLVVSVGVLALLRNRWLTRP